MSSFAAEVDTLSGDSIVEESEVSDSLVIDEVFEQEVVDNEEQEEIVQEEVEEEPAQEEVVEEEQEQLTEEQVKDIAQTVVEENSQGHVNEEQVVAIVEDTLNQEGQEEYLPIEEAEGIMLLIEYELDTKILCDDGKIFYLPSEILKDYPYFHISYFDKEYTAYFYTSYSMKANSSEFKFNSPCCKFDVTNSNFGDMVSVTLLDGNYVSGISLLPYFSHDVYLTDGTLFKQKNISMNNDFSIRFSTGYDNISFEPIQTDENGLVESLPVPEIAPNGLVFEGWYLDELYNTKVDESYVFTSNTTLYAKWVESNSINIEVIDYTDKIDTITCLIEYIIGILVFFVIVILCKYVYSFFNIFF